MSTKLLDFLGDTMHSATECLMMQRKDNFNSEIDFSNQHDMMAIFKKSLSSYQLVDTEKQAAQLPSINDLD